MTSDEKIILCFFNQLINTIIDNDTICIEIDAVVGLYMLEYIITLCPDVRLEPVTIILITNRIGICFDDLYFWIIDIKTIIHIKDNNFMVLFNPFKRLTSSHEVGVVFVVSTNNKTKTKFCHSSLRSPLIRLT